MSEFSAKRMIGICGACVAYYIGAGFATMQEVVQYEASYGSQFLIVIAVAAAIYIYTNLSFATNGNRMHIEHGGDIYKVYCGKKIGTFYDYFAAFFCYMCFIVKCSSANSVATELWGLPNGIGARNNLKEVNVGMMISAVAVFAASIVCCIALVANISEIWSDDVPALTLAHSIHPVVELAFALIIFAGIYTTALPLLWTGIIKLAEEGTKKYKRLTVIGGILGFLIGFLPYKSVLNVLYGVNGYLGFLLIIFMIWHDVRKRLSHNQS